MKPHKQLFYAYAMMYRPYINQLNAELSPFSLSSPYWSIMHRIVNEGPQTISDISIRQNVEKPTITKMVQRLGELGYVEAVSGDDKRTRFIQLTDKGREVFDQVQLKLDIFQKELAEDMSEDEQLMIARALENIRKKIENRNF
ncbi:putative HTH-type transcriptional regulator [compost metagenome]